MKINNEEGNKYVSKRKARYKETKIKWCKCEYIEIITEIELLY